MSLETLGSVYYAFPFFHQGRLDIFTFSSVESVFLILKLQWYYMILVSYSLNVRLYTKILGYLLLLILLCIIFGHLVSWLQFGEHFLLGSNIHNTFKHTVYAKIHTLVLLPETTVKYVYLFA